MRLAIQQLKGANTPVAEQAAISQINGERPGLGTQLQSISSDAGGLTGVAMLVGSRVAPANEIIVLFLRYYIGLGRLLFIAGLTLCTASSFILTSKSLRTQLHIPSARSSGARA